jgi:hypothetical protein
MVANYPAVKKKRLRDDLTAGARTIASGPPVINVFQSIRRFQEHQTAVVGAA